MFRRAHARSDPPATRHVLQTSKFNFPTNPGDLCELEEFTEAFVQKRMELNLSQKMVARSLKQLYGINRSATFISRIERLDIGLSHYLSVYPVLLQWLKGTEDPETCEAIIRTALGGQPTDSSTPVHSQRKMVARSLKQLYGINRSATFISRIERLDIGLSHYLSVYPVLLQWLKGTEDPETCEAIIRTALGGQPTDSSTPVHSQRTRRLGLRIRLASYLRATSAHHLAPTSSGISKSIFKPRRPVYLAAFNVRTLKRAVQQAAVALTLDSLGFDVCCVSETRIQDTSTVTELTAPSVSTRFQIRISGDPEATAARCAGVGIVPSHRAKVSLIDWVPVDSHLFAFRLATSVD
ncbi:hypothetical protein T265_09900 [Opisthorchis viverrini]|uniref:POU-specific domain-containing protein n=1 Tax=Opisthorchis viverrini TaxID=6198 RepID=A0A074ZF56_OPIVI|nr:hypothetical protein T265_09900 [Opisthorchis viverrini]KER21865.1 hypothetical protein T265_09900 [Opisthorchis viverrini]